MMDYYNIIIIILLPFFFFFFSVKKGEGIIFILKCKGTKTKAKPVYHKKKKTKK